MIRRLKSISLVLAGLCWVGFAVGFGAIFLAYLTAANELSGFVLFAIPAAGVLGLIHVIGFATAAFLCFAVGVGLCAHGLVPPPPSEHTPPIDFKKYFGWLRFEPLALPTEPEDSTLPRCVRCQTALPQTTRWCPACGWTQPPYRSDRKR